MIIKIFLIASVLAVGIWLLRGRQHGSRLAITRIATMVFGASWVLGVIAPELVTRVANVVGVGRGTDLVLYVLVVAFLFSAAGQHQKVAQLSNDVAELTRTLAVVEHRTRADLGLSARAERASMATNVSAKRSGPQRHASGR